MNMKSTKFILAACAVFFALSLIGYLSLRNYEKPQPQVERIAKGTEKKAHGLSDSEKLTAQKEGKDEKAQKVALLADQQEDHRWLDGAKSAINSPDINARFKAVFDLGKHPTPEAVDLLTLFLNDSNSDLVEEAIDQLGSIALKNSELNESVYKLLEAKAKDRQFSKRGQALVIAATLGLNDRILPVISDLISEKDSQARLKVFASRALAFIASPESIPQLRLLLGKSKDPEIHRMAFGALAKIATPEATDLLAEQVHSSDEKDQVSSAWALSLKNEEEYNQVLISAIAGGTIGGKALSVIAKSPAAPAVFSELLQKNDIGKDDKVSLLNTLSENTIFAPSEVQSGVVSAVNPLLDSTDPDLEIAAIRTLGKVGAGKAIAEMLLPKLESDSPLVREEALNAYALHCNPINYKPVLDMIWDREENIRRSALTLSQPFLTESDRAVLEEALNHEDEFIRKHVEKILLDQFS